MAATFPKIRTGDDDDAGRAGPDAELVTQVDDERGYQDVETNEITNCLSSKTVERPAVCRDRVQRGHRRSAVGLQRTGTPARSGPGVIPAIRASTAITISPVGEAVTGRWA
jgi:hypothetical protein